VIGIVGGTGPEGIGLAVRWAVAHETIGIGSRSPERAMEAAHRIRCLVPGAAIEAADNLEIVGRATVIVVAIPFGALESTLAPVATALRRKLVISVVAAVEWVDGRPKPIAATEGSVALKVQALLPGARVTSGFHTLSAELLADPGVELNEDCLVCGDDTEDRRTVMNLARKIQGVRAISGGRLENSFYPEVLVGLLATINRIHKVHSGLRLTGLPL
jgi:NADPH-dependent F420 reductase